MRKFNFLKLALFSAAAVSIGCQGQTGTTNANLVNTNANLSNTFANGTNMNSSNMNSASTSAIETREPDQYSATVALKFEAMGDTQTASMPTIGAVVARSGADRRMEFNLPPNNEKVIYLDKAGTNYVIFPNRKQYAELTQESMGFEVRRMLMPEQIVNQVKSLQGVRLIGEENVGGRQVMKYAYNATANTQTQAGQVATESFILVDKETGLPLRSETVAQSQTGGNVQGYKGLRLVTEMSDIKATPDPALFAAPPADFQKVEAEQVRAQVNLIFNVVGTFLGQMMQRAQTNQAPAANTAASPAASPTASPAN